MSNVKGKGQRLIPEELLKYLEALKNKYPDAVDLVEANPTLEGGEDSLSSVLINGTKYAVGGGSDIHLYQHSLWLNMENLYYVYCDILSNSETPFTVSNLASFIYNRGDALRIQATGQIRTHAIATHLESSGTDTFKVSGIDIYDNVFTDTNSISANITTIIDHVEQLI